MFTFGQPIETAKIPSRSSSSESPPLCAPSNKHLLKATPPKQVKQEPKIEVKKVIDKPKKPEPKLVEKYCVKCE